MGNKGFLTTRVNTFTRFNNLKINMRSGVKE